MRLGKPAIATATIKIPAHLDRLELRASLAPMAMLELMDPKAKKDHQVSTQAGATKLPSWTAANARKARKANLAMLAALEKLASLAVQVQKVQMANPAAPLQETQAQMANQAS